MKKTYAFLIVGTLFIVHCSLFIDDARAAGATIAIPSASGAATTGAAGGIKINKGPAVQEQQQEKMDAVGGTNLAATAMGLFAGYQALKQQDLALTEKCAPTDSEAAYVNKMVEEYAKTGQMSGDKMFDALKVEKCGSKDDFIARVGVEGLKACYPKRADAGKIWNEYPEAISRSKCPDSSPGCKDKKYYSNIYEIYNLMGWTDKDMLPDELSAHSKLMAKAEECDPRVMQRKRQEMTGGFITGTIGSIGQKQNTGGTMGVVSTLTQTMSQGGGGANSAIGGIGALAPSLLTPLLGGGM